MEFLNAPFGPLTVAPASRASTLSVSLIVPTYQERENICDFLRALQPVLTAALPGQHEVIVVDDESPDGTAEAALALTGQYPELRVVVRRGEKGLSSAVIRGWQVARGAAVGTINADFQHPPEVMGRMVAALANADVVVASRYSYGGSVGEWSRHRQIFSNGAHLAGRLLLPRVFGRVSDPLSGCYLVKRAAIEGVELRPVGYKTLIEILARGRVTQVAECGYRMHNRRLGNSKVKAIHWLQYVRHLLRLNAAMRGNPR